MGKLKAKMIRTQLPDSENGTVSVQFNLSVLLLPASLSEVIHEEQHQRNPHCTRHEGLELQWELKSCMNEAEVTTALPGRAHSHRPHDLFLTKHGDKWDKTADQSNLYCTSASVQD